jgi:hypothetical protein
MTEFTAAQMEAIVEAGVKKAFADKQTLTLVFGDVIRQIAKEEAALKWDRAFGVDCTRYESVQSLRADFEFLRELHKEAQTPGAKRAEYALKELAKIEDISILKDVANIATKTKEKIIRIFVIAAFAAFFVAAGWSVHQFSPRKLLE